MTRKRKRKLAAKGMLSGVLGGSICAVGAAATGAPTNDPAKSPQSQSDLAEVVVTAARYYRPTVASSATKFDLPLIETPQSVSVITSDVISNLGVTSIPDAANYAAAFNTQANQGAGLYTGTFYIRGIRLDKFRGFKLNDYPFGVTGIPDTVGVDRIEVPKGPTSIVYGYGNYGGVVNIITKKPPAKLEWQGELSGGSYDDYRVETMAGGPLTSSGNVRALLAAAYGSANTFVQGEYRKTFALAPSLTAEFDERTRLEFFGYYQNVRGRVGGSMPVLEEADGRIVLPTFTPQDSFNGNPDASLSTFDVKSAVLALSRDLSDSSTLKLVVNGASSKSKVRSIYAGYYATPAATGESTVYALAQDETTTSKTVELSYLNKFQTFGQQSQVYSVAGMDSLHYDEQEVANNLGSVNVFNPNFSQFTGPYPTPQDYLDGNYSGFQFFNYRHERDYNVGTQLLLNVTSRLGFLVGARSDWLRIERVTSPGTAAQVVAIDSRQMASYRASLLYKITDQVNGYLHYSQGFTPQLSFVRSGGTVGNELVTQYEAGFKSEFLNKQLGLTGSVYELDTTNTAIADPRNGPGQSFAIAGGRGRNRGAEIEVQGQVGKGFSIMANYAYIESKLLAAADPALIGQSAPVGPNNTARVLLNYAFQKGTLLAGAQVGIGIRHDGVTKQGFFTSNAGRPPVFVPAYDVVDARVAYEISDAVKVQLNIRNLLGEKYFLPAVNTYIVNYGEPRAFRLSLSYKY